MIIGSVVTVVIGLGMLVIFLDDIRTAYWHIASPGRGPELYGTRVARIIPSDTPYDRWLELARRDMPVREGAVIDDVATVALQPWPTMGEGVNGLYLRFADYQITDGRILEIPAGGQARSSRHLFEVGVYAIAGSGYTLFFPEGQAPMRLDWQAGSLFSIPLNVRYQHFNSGPNPLRFLMVTSLPFALNSTDNEDFIFSNEFNFADRFDGSPDFFERREVITDVRVATNFVPDAMTAELSEDDHRGKGRTTMAWAMAGNQVLDMHVSQMLPRTHMKAHRHSSDAFLLLLSGEGYSLIWNGDDVAGRKRIDWRKGTLFVPPTYWYHQHFNIGGVPSRHLAINAPTLVRNLGLRFSDQIETDSPEIATEWQEVSGGRSASERP